MNHDDDDDDNKNKRRRLLVAAVAASFFFSNSKAKKFTSGSRMKRRSNPDYRSIDKSNKFEGENACPIYQNVSAPLALVLL